MAPAPPPPPEDSAPDLWHVRQEADLAILRELIEMGMRTARLLEQRIAARDEPVPSHADPVQQLGQVAKMVRLTVALKAKLIAEDDRECRAARRLDVWRAGLSRFQSWRDSPRDETRVVERLVESEADPDEVVELLKELADQPKRERESGPRGLSSETVRAIKERILGVRLDDPYPSSAPVRQTPMPPRGLPP